MLLETKIGKLIVLIYTRVYLGTLSSQTSKYTQICVYIQTCIYIFIHTYTYIYIFLHACTYVHVIHMNIFRNYEFLPIQFQSISSELVLAFLCFLCACPLFHSINPDFIQYPLFTLLFSPIRL